MSRHGLLARSALAASMLAAAGPLAAQDNATPETPTSNADPQSAEEGEEVIVTAQKREQNLIDVPQSISVVGGETLERQQATNFQDYLKLVPGLNLNQSTPGVGRLVLRGVNTGGVASTVAVYVDETVFGSSSGQANGAILAADVDPFDIARIEVLRGPQGTLYGASSLGGVLKFVTNAPRTDRFEARARGTVETVDGGDLSYFGNALVNVPLGDTLAFRASGFYRKFGGFIDSIGTGGSDVAENINDTDTYGGRASLLFEPTDLLSVRLSAYLQNLNSDASSAVDSDPVTSRTLYGRLSQSQFVPEFTDVRYRVFSGTVSFDVGFGDLVSATSYATLKQRFRGDLTTQFGPVIEGALGIPNEFLINQRTEVEKFTQELRLSSKANGRFEWLVGGFYTKEAGLIDQAFDAVTPGTLTPIAGLPLLGTALLPSDYDEYAAFANATIYFGERFDLTFGGRFSRNEQSASQISDGILAGGPGAIIDDRSSDDVFTFSVAPKFNLSDRASIYARVAKGYRPGGPNILPPEAPADTPTTYEADTLVSYEIGIKAETDDRRFSIDAAAFYIDWSDIQLFTVVNGFGINANGAGAESKGVEFTATTRPLDGFSLSVNGAYTDATLTGDTGPLVGGLEGDRLPYTPEFSVGVNGDYEFPVGADAEAFVGGSFRYLTRQPAGFDAAFQEENGRQRYLPAYEVVDLRAGVEFGGRFSIEAFARNLTNSRGKTDVTSVGNVPNGAVLTGIIRPRAFGVSLGAGF